MNKRSFNVSIFGVLILCGMLVSLLSAQALGHFVFSKLAGDYNISIEFVRVADDFDPNHVHDDSHSHDGDHDVAEAQNLSPGNYQINVYLLRNMSEPVDDANVQVTLSSEDQIIGPISLSLSDPASYYAIQRIPSPGLWDAQTNIIIPSESDPITMDFTELEFEPAKGSNSLMLLLIGIGIIGVAVFIIFGPRSRKQTQGE
jgi:hypothetical protein